MIGYPPLEGKGSPMLTQNRQFQWYHVGSYIFPVVAGSAATLLDRDDFEVKWVDGIVDGLTMEDFYRDVESESPDLILLESKTPVIRQHWSIVERIKEFSPKTRTLFCGDHVTALPHESMEGSVVDYVLAGGNYDLLVHGLARHIRDGAPLPPGIFYRENGKVKSSGDFVLEHDLDELPWINRTLTQAVKYGEKWKRRTPFFYTMAGRDCHWGKCTFCSWTTLYPRFKVRTPENLLDEIGTLIKDHGVKEIFDDTGTFPGGVWLERFCEGMIDRGYNKEILFSCNMRFDMVTPERAALMKRAGFRKIKSGLESANQSTLDRIEKGTTVEQIVEGCKTATRAGLEVQLTVMVGYPWETREEVHNTINLAKKLMAGGHAEMLQATVVVPYPGTPLHRMAMDNDWFRIDPGEYERFDMTEPMLKTPGLTPEEVVKLCGGVYKTFLTPSFIVRHILSIRTREDLSYFLRGVKAIWGHLEDFLKDRKNN